ncbi:hypothetical protein [Ornithinimicrobium kibberense]
MRSAAETSTVSFTRVGDRFSTALFTAGAPEGWGVCGAQGTTERFTSC